MKIKVIEHKKIWFAISIFVIVTGLVSFALNGLNFGIDFVGGNILHYNIGERFRTGEVREVLGKFNLEDSEVKKAGDEGHEVIIRTRVLSETEKDKLFEELKQKWPQIEVVRLEKVDAIIGAELREKAILAVTIAAIGMIIYITLRFEFKFAISAILAIVHDVLIVMSIFAILQIPINSPFLAALLTIVGYSINDTIVVFDRIRENIKLSKKQTLSEMVNTSIIQSLTRSINTSFTTLVTIIALYLLGGETIKSFALALIIGIVSGTYSSIFIASPIWVVLKSREKGVKI